VTEPAETPEWRKLVDRAKHLIDLNRPEEARQYAARAAAMAPGEAAPMCVLAIATSHAGQLEAALEHASRAVGLAPELDWPHRVRGYILDELGRYDEAVAAGQEAVRLAPAEAPGYNLLAGSLRLAGRLEEAETAAARLRELAPESYEAYEVSAEVAYDRERWAEAERWAREGLRLEPGSGRLRIVLGWILTVRAQFDEAIDHVHEGVRNAPLDAWHRESLEKVTVQHSDQRSNLLSLIVICLPASLYLAWLALGRWRAGERDLALFTGSVGLGLLALSLGFIRALPRRLPKSLRRLRREQLRRALLWPFGGRGQRP